MFNLNLPSSNSLPVPNRRGPLIFVHLSHFLPHHLLSLFRTCACMAGVTLPSCSIHLASLTPTTHTPLPAYIVPALSIPPPGLVAVSCSYHNLLGSAFAISDFLYFSPFHLYHLGFRWLCPSVFPPFIVLNLSSYTHVSPRLKSRFSFTRSGKTPDYITCPSRPRPRLDFV